MSAHMRYACRNEIAKHKDFYEFLVSVWALKEKNGGYIVNEFHIVTGKQIGRAHV